MISRLMRRLGRPSVPDPVRGLDVVRRADDLIAQLGQHHPPSSDHSWRVAAVVMAIVGRAPSYGLAPADAILAGLLHDIGKLKIPATILCSPDRLGPVELRLVRAHPRAGAEILLRSGMPANSINGALFHHEHWNGLGYPGGLAGLAIPRVARLVSVADVLVAMVEPGRQYREPLPIPDATERLEGLAGSQLDAAYVPWLRQMIGRADLERLVADPAFCRRSVMKFLARFATLGPGLAEVRLAWATPAAAAG